MSKTEVLEVGERYDTSVLLSRGMDIYKIAMASKMPKFDCRRCFYPIVPTLNTRSLAVSGTVTCPTCASVQIDNTKAEAERRLGREAIMGTSTLKTPQEPLIQRTDFPDHRLFRDCECQICGTRHQNVTVIRGEVKGVRCACGVTNKNIDLANRGVEVVLEKDLYGAFGPAAMVEV